MSRCDCCGCILAGDGTSVVTGTGTRANPYTIAMEDASWRRPSARIRRTSNQAVATGDNFTVVSFDTAVFQEGVFWSIGSPTLIGIPEDGIYLFGGCTRWQANDTGTRELGFRLNGLNVIALNDQPVDTFNDGVNHWSEITYQQRLGAGETLELVARQESGGSLNLVTDDENSVVFWIAYMGRVI